MGFLIFVLVIALIWLWSEVSALRTRQARLDEQVIAARDQIGTLTARVAHLEHGHPGAIAPMKTPAADTSATVTPRVVSPVVASASAVAPAAPPPVVASAPVVTPPEPPVVIRPAASTPAESVPTVARTAQPAPPPPLPTASPRPTTAVAAASAESAESWEMVVGTSWLNKIGVLVFIVGVALLVAYSFAHIGPAGRVAIGFALSFGMLAGGVVLEKRAAFRNYAYGLVAGGWAGVYFTTFAMHDVPGAKIIDSDVMAVSLLSLVATGMIAHSLRYQSKVVTSLAFVVGYVTLALSPMSGFALAASVPLAVAMLVVAQHFGWSSVAVLGIASAYGTFVIRSEVFPGTGLDRDSTLRYATLGSYWLAFEAAEIVALWRRRRTAAVSGTAAPVSMLALNAVGFVGAVIVTAPGDNPQLFSTFLFGTSAAYVVSAAVRAWLAPDWRARPGAESTFDSTHAATAAAATLTAWAIGLRFSGNRESLARLFEAQLLITAGLTLGDVWLRRMGSIALLLAAGWAWLHAATFGAGATMFTGLSLTPGTTTAVLGFIALAAYGNREALHRRAAQPVWLEGAFTWTASLLLATTFALEFTPAHEALAGLVLAAVLLEVGFRRSPEYIYQSYVLGGAAAYAMLAAFVAPVAVGEFIGQWGLAPTNLDEWLVLPASAVLAAAAAWRLWTRPGDARIPGRVIAAGVSATLATAFLVVFEWRVLSPNAIAPAWALTAAGLVALGAWRRLWPLRWQGYALALTTTVRAIRPLYDGPPQSNSEIAAIAVVIAAVYAAAYLGRRALPDSPTASLQEGDSPEGAVVAMLSVIATGSFVVFKWRVLPELMVAPAWAATGLILLALGIYRARPGQRWQGYALTSLGAARVMSLLLNAPTATLAASLWAIAVVGTTYAATWTARRFSDRTKDSAVVLQALPMLGTLAFVVLQSRVFEDPQLGPSWAATGVAFLGLGLWRHAADLRWQGYALLTFGALRAGRPVFAVDEAATSAVIWLSAVIGALYVCGLIVRRATRAADVRGMPEPAEDVVGSAVLLGATALLAALVLQEVRPSAVTLALGVQGLALMFTGLAARERVLRLAGLALLLACILKLFVYDLRELEALARIMSFVALGLFLLAISWTYTRYREQIQKFL